jgi:hypothetical protein
VDTEEFADPAISRIKRLLITSLIPATKVADAIEFGG